MAFRPITSPKAFNSGPPEFPGARRASVRSTGISLRRVRAEGANRATPILVVSVMSDHDSIERCRLLGATAFVAKPVDRELITTMLRSLLTPKRAGAQPEDRNGLQENGG